MWYYLFSENNITTTTIDIQESLFVLSAATKNSDLALFSKYDIDTGNVHLYFSPGTESVAKSFGAIPCGKPSTDQVGKIIFGDQTLVNRLFP